MFEDETAHRLLLRALGAVVGVVASMIMVAPAGTRNALYRALVGVTMGFIFAPLVPHVWGLSFLSGDGGDYVLARGATAGFVVWWVLEAVARLLSSNDWAVELLQEAARLRAKRGGR